MSLTFIETSVFTKRVKELMSDDNYRCLQNWEVGRSKPYGAAKVLLRVMDSYPKAISLLSKKTGS